MSARPPKTADEAFDDYAKRIALRGALEATWPAGTPLIRCHPNLYGPATFYAGSPARYSPFLPAVAGPGTASSPVGVLYAADSQHGALSETVFRDLPVRGVKRITRSNLRRKNLSELVVSRPLTLVNLTTRGLARLGLRRRTEIESSRKQYWRTCQLARAVHALPENYDGLLWVSRQDDTSRAIVLFEGRVMPSDIDTNPAVPTYPLDFGLGRDRVDEIADDLGITIIDR